MLYILGWPWKYNKVCQPCPDPSHPAGTIKVLYRLLSPMWILLFAPLHFVSLNEWINMSRTTQKAPLMLHITYGMDMLTSSHLELGREMLIVHFHSDRSLDGSTMASLPSTCFPTQRRLLTALSSEPRGEGCWVWTANTTAFPSFIFP